MPRLPKEIYVKFEGDKGQEYLAATQAPAEFASSGETVRAGKYVLVSDVVIEAPVKVTRKR